jgi:hypothetical protein
VPEKKDMIRSYTVEDAPEAKSCQEALSLYVEEFVSARGRIKRILQGVRDTIKKGLEKGVSRRKLLDLINSSDELQQQRKITLSEFSRYCRDEFPELGLERNRNGAHRKNTVFGQAVEEKLERKTARI